jgi:Tol biopolymer transport system component
MSRLPPPSPPPQPRLVYRPAYPPPPDWLPSRRQPQRGSPILAPALALLGLLLVGGASIWGVSLVGGIDLAGAAAEPSPGPGGELVAAASTGPEGSLAPDGAEGSPDPAIFVPEADPTDLPDVVGPPADERATVTGTIVFSRAGDIWTVAGQELHRLTDADSTKSDGSPTWSPDGKSIYFIRTTKRPTEDSRPGGLYTLYTTDLWRMRADGSQRERVYDSLIRDGSGTWFSHVLQPDVGAGGTNVAVVSDGPDGSGPVELHTINSRSGRISRVAAQSEGDLGHNDPDFSPDGKRIAFTYNHAQGTDGVPRIGIFSCRARDCSSGSMKLLRPGYAHPSWAPDGSWLAVEATRGSGRDIVIIDPRRGDVRVALTNDGDSFAPVVSPNGDQIAYLHRDGIDIDIRLMTLEISPDGRITLVEDRAVTDDGSIDGDSPPEWFIPRELRTNLDDSAPEAGGSPSPSAEPSSAAAPSATAPQVLASAEGVPPPPG